MITTVCLNPCIDRTVRVAEFRYGATNRVHGAKSDAGGKGVNVARAASKLGLETECLTFLRKTGGKDVENSLLSLGVASATIWLEGSLRVNMKILDESRGTITEINEPGEPVTEKDIKAMTDLVCLHAQDSDFLVFSGSLPPGCPLDYYRTLIEAVEGLSCRCVLDAAGEPLTEGLKAHPFLIKPNRAELEGVMKCPLKDLHQIRDAALHYIAEGVSVVAVSMGADGAFITDGMESFYAPALAVEVQSTVGAGDAMVAGLTAGFLADLPLREAFIKGVACATARIMTEGTALMDKSVYRALMDKIHVQSV